ncbi:putative ABC transporter, P-loop containing nucleoside triphosphate hydrolase [Rosa chinensis]|uniref:Putative ABC transporter, P-loop containing nucleoside triphosphate hydrolase n=1 Tax=Rosa chinensis TaxID=74649 RepID=A0A2P6REA7_ROSCH|nr:ABC transporter A family member 1 [Rosa chinensis]PRQ44758.1 putative ABC transporter, P-loop containing nucleoside triphosphate hydrolase [Rosa chinensis]
MGTGTRQLKAMLRKNWLLKIRHPFVTCAEILLPTVVMLMLIAVRTRVDTQIHPSQPYIRKGMLVEVGKGISPNFEQVLELLLKKEEILAFAPDTEETRSMINVMSMKFPLLKHVSRVYKDEQELETYIRSNLYGTCNQIMNCSNPKIKGAVVFHEQGPQLFDYSIRLNHTWAFSGFPDVKSIMDTNGPYLNDLELGVNTVPTMQYSCSGFLTLQQALDSFIIFAAQQSDTRNIELPTSLSSSTPSSLKVPWTRYGPSNIRIVPFPTREYTDDEFQSIIKSVMGVLYLLGFLYPISRLISYSVFEKEQKIREGLYMMGLKDGVFHLSWFIAYALQFAVSSLIITVCTMDNLFKYSDKSVVFIYFFFFGISAIMLSFLISTFFERAKTAVAVGTLAFLGAFFPYYSVNDEAVPMILKVIASLLSPTAFALGSINFADYERAHVGLRWSNIWRASSGVNFSVCLLMMLLDALLYCVIGLYLDKVLPRENGVRYPWNFIFQKCFWKNPNINKHHNSSPEVHIRDKVSQKAMFSRKENAKAAVEAITFDMRQQELDHRCIHIRNLHKVYASKKGKCCAVNSLQLTMYENQILALLGHNGAGKSTTISMLVGLLRPTSGDAMVFGKNIMTDMEEIRKELGVCPQHDILFPELTVKEHLEIFAILKGVQEDFLNSVVIDMVDQVGLADKINTAVMALSGGMKRKLSLGIALIGNSKVIILDEPTSGMDPYSMRLTWQLIKKIRKGRIVLLTTHSMDEAEALGDRIAIMANGSLKCCGSSLFLKHQYGVGYTLTLVKSAPTASMAADIVYRHIPSATCVSEVGTEISFKLPLASSTSFESMFREIESCMGSSTSNLETSCDEKDYIGIESYGISVTTLEEVFLRVAGCDYDEAAFFDQKNGPLCPESLISQTSHDPTHKQILHSKKSFAYYKEILGVLFTMVGKACGLIFATVLSFLNFLGVQCCGCCIISRSTFWRHSKALFIKRAISARRDRKTIVFQLVIPAVFLFFGLLFLKLKPHPDQESVTFTTSHFNPLLRGGGGGGPIPFDLSRPIAQEVAEYIEGGWIQTFKPSGYKFPNSEKALNDAIEVAGETLGPALLSMSEFLMSSFNESYQSRYGAVVMDDQSDDGSLGYTVLHNSSCQHAAPTFINLVNAAILRLASRNKNVTIQTRNHPLPMTNSQHLQRHDLDAFSAAVIVSIAFSFIPASFAVPIVKEREVKAKHQQLISGVSILSYWTSTYIWDFISFLFPSSFAIVLFYTFGLDQFIGRGCLLSTVVMFLAYGLAIASSTYCLTFFFSDHTMAQNVVLLVHFFTGLILMVISFIMGLIKTTTSANSFLKNFFRLSPGFCFADGLASLALLRQDMKNKSNKAFDWNVTGGSICYLCIESICYFLLALGLEILPFNKLTLATLKEWWKSIKSIPPSTSSYREPLLTSSTESVTLDLDEDTDVKAERTRVLSGSIDNAIIYLRNLHKVYPGGQQHATKVAVHSLTFSVQEGECFGFLGTNGAGKTTTLSMLTGEESPTDGTACIFGKDISSNPKAARQHIGFCPQFDALLEYLTVQEHLELYATIKGVPDNKIAEVVMEKLVEFDLLKHAGKPSFSLSGGNKRKLSVAIAMIGDPPIVILDEPSTGMDPIAKRFMWEVISRLSTRRGKTAVILTTHSMNEAQALCTRIGIMVGGQLRCIGSPQHLKTRFGNHLELEVKPIEVSSVDLDKLCRVIQERLSYVPSHPMSLLDGLEVCIGATDSIVAENASVAEISLSREMIIMIGRWLGNEERIKPLISSTPLSDGVLGEQLFEQLDRDGGIPLPIFSEWWLFNDKFSAIDSFVLTSFPGAMFQGMNGLSVKYQLPCGPHLSLADVFGHLERKRNRLGIAEYSISQSTLETIFNHFAANS